MKIALAQINPVIGDFAHNLERIFFWIGRARDLRADLVVFPELALSGYPPQDLLDRSTFIRDHDTALAHLLASAHGIGVICGVLERHTGPHGKPYHNCAVLFEDGEVLFTARKRLLPTYDVFDETRYFEPARQSGLVRYKGLSLGLTICEDIWSDLIYFSRHLYEVDPVAELAKASGTGLDLLVNISASPFHIGKYAARQRMFANICSRWRVPLVYVNQVGGQDSLLFDGRSLVLDRDGLVKARAADFDEDLVLYDTDTNTGECREGLQEEGRDEADAVLAALVLGVRDYVTKCGFAKGVLGLSGGIDSAITAAVAARALGPENVLGVALPSPYTASESVEDARKLADNLGIRFEIIPISTIFEAHLATLAPLFGDLAPDVTEQNIQARIRGNLLMALANKFGFLLLSTGNKSEMAVGYCTLYGDMSGGLAVISDVPKGLVYRLAHAINKNGTVIPERIISKPPSAELKPNQRDQDDLPPYEILDPIIKAYLEDNLGIGEIARMGFDRAMVEDVVGRITRNEYKRKQAPLGLRVTTKAFGYGRRYPTAQRYREGKDF